MPPGPQLQLGIADVPVGVGPDKVVGTNDLAQPAGPVSPGVGFSGADIVGYDDARVAPLLGVDTVQEAIDAIKGGGGGGADLAATLVLGNLTGGTDIELSAGDSVVGVNAVSGQKAAGGIARSAGGVGDPTPANATLTITVLTAPVANNQSLLFSFNNTGSWLNSEIRAAYLSSVLAARTPGLDNFDGSLGTPDLIAAEIAAALNDQANSFAGSPAVTAIAVGPVVTVTATQPGEAGNRISVQSSFSALQIATGTQFGGGWNGPGSYATNTMRIAPFAVFGAGNIVINGVTLTGVAGARTSGANDFDNTKPNENAQATEIASAINDPANTFDTVADVTAVAELAPTNNHASNIKLYAKTAGTAGNAYTLSSTVAGTSLFLLNATFSGGTDSQVAGPILLGVGTLGSVALRAGGGPRGLRAVDLQGAGSADWMVPGSDESALLGGHDNAIVGPGSARSLIFGGYNNLIDATLGEAYGSVIVGGYGNRLQPVSGADSGGASDVSSYSFLQGKNHRVLSRAKHSVLFGDNNLADGRSYSYYTANYAFMTGSGNYVQGGSTYAGLPTDHATVFGSLNVQRQASYSLAFGRSNDMGGISPNNADHSMAFGRSNRVQSSYTVALGRSNQSHYRAKFGAAFGANTYLYSQGQVAHGSGNTGLGFGKQQAAEYTIFATVTGAAATELTTDGAAPNAKVNRVCIKSGRSWNFRIQVITRQQSTAGGGSTGDTAMWVVQGTLKNPSGTTALVGAPTGTGAPLFSDAGLATLSLAVTANNTDDAINVTITGIASKVLHHMAVIYTAEVG
jgi:hypothetical protein